MYMYIEGGTLQSLAKMYIPKSDRVIGKKSGLLSIWNNNASSMMNIEHISQTIEDCFTPKFDLLM